MSQKFQPTPADIVWLKTLMRNLKVGGVWCAPMGFTFQKTGEKTLRLQGINATLSGMALIIDTLERTVITGKAGGIEVQTEGCADYAILIDDYFGKRG